MRWSVEKVGLALFVGFFVVAGAAGALGIGDTSQDRPDPVSAATASDTDRAGDLADNFSEDRVEGKILTLVNEERNEIGMDALKKNQRASRAATSHAEDMAENDYYNHTSPDGQTQEERYAFCDGGENIAMSGLGLVDTYVGEVTIQTESDLAENIVNQWMKSTPHRERGLYGEWSSAGVGIGITETGEVYAVMGFCE